MNRLLHRCDGATVVPKRRKRMLGRRRRKGMLDMLRRRAIRAFFITFHHWNFKTPIKLSTLVICKFNPMYLDLKLEHQQVLIKRQNHRML